MKYKLTKEYDAENYCSKCNVDGQTYYLSICENGKTLQELFNISYELTLLIMNYNSLSKIIKE